ncbi:MAG: FAD:protein FMN transferase [Alistipes timonensis]|nr:FAD:protein FMN transferase [Alistipes timonensis]
MSINRFFPLRRVAGALLCAAALALGSCGGADRWQTCEGSVWNTTFSIKYRFDRDLSDSIAAVMREVELSLSPFNPGSRISKINRGEAMRADSLILRVFDISTRVCEASEGRFDPTVSPLVNLWGFGYEKRGRRDDFAAPSRESVDSALALVGLLDCRIDSSLNMVKKSAGTTFNFSAVTKGFGCDRVGEMLRRNGVEDYLVEIGGELALAGRNQRGGEWRVQIDAPVVDAGAGHTPMLTIALTDRGVASSGNYRNFRTDSLGNRYGHTIDPVSGFPCQSDVVAATVVAPDCATADALATACMASGREGALRAVGSIAGAEALLVVASGDSLAIERTAGFPEPR